MEQVVKTVVGMYSRPCFGERVIGDSMLVKDEDAFTFLALIDGIGHGVKAEAISKKIVDYLTKRWTKNPSEMIEKTHEFMSGSEGAVIGLVIIDKRIGKLQFAGLGNISCRLLGHKNSTFVTTDGLLGVRKRTVNNTAIELNDKDIILMYSDGVSSNFHLDKIPNYRSMSPSVLAKKIVKEFGSDFDDASCIVGKITCED